MKQVEMAVLIFAIILVGVFASLRPVAGVSEAASSPAACSAGDWLTRVIEDAAGVLTPTCATVSQEIASSCAANQFASSESAAGALTCSLVNWANSITAFPSACAANGFVSQIAATLTCTSSDLIQGSKTISSYAKTLLNSTSIGWDFRTGTNTILAKLLSQACPSNQFVTTVADTISCMAHSLVQGSRTIAAYSVTFLNSTSIGWDFRTASNTILAKLLSQVCPSNQFATTIADAIACTSSDLVQGARTISGYSKTLLNSTSIGWDFRPASNTALGKLQTQSCPANQFVTIVADTITCAAASSSAINNRVTSTFTRTVTTFANVAGLSFTLAANTNYQFMVFVIAKTTGTGSINVAIGALPSGATFTACASELGGTIGSTDGCSSTTGTGLMAGAQSGTSDEPFMIWGSVVVGSTGGTLNIQAADVAGAGSIVIEINSWIQAQISSA